MDFVIANLEMESEECNNELTYTFKCELTMNNELIFTSD